MNWSKSPHTKYKLFASCCFDSELYVPFNHWRLQSPSPALNSFLSTVLFILLDLTASYKIDYITHLQYGI